MKTFDQTVQATSGRAAAVSTSTPGGQRHHLPGGDEHLLGVPAAGEQRAHLVADLPARRRPAPTAAIRPLHSSPMTSLAPGGGG